MEGMPVAVWTDPANPGVNREFEVYAGFDKNHDGDLNISTNPESNEAFRCINMTIVKVKIHNDINPSWGEAEDSDDVLCIGDIDVNGNIITPAKIFYSILPQDLQPVSKTIMIRSEGSDIRMINTFEQGEKKAYEWDGKSSDGTYNEKEIYDIELEVLLPPDLRSVSDTYQIIDLGVRHKPNLYIHPTEFSPPIDVSFALVNAEIWENQAKIADPPGDIDTLLTSYDNTDYYLKLPEEKQRDTTGASKAVYIREKTENLSGKTYVFCQYWMYYSISTLPIDIDDPKDPDATTDNVRCHGGDWEMAMVVVELNPEGEDPEEKYIPFGVFCSAHYYGVSLNWYALPPGTSGWCGEDYVNKSNNHPNLQIAAGAHATYFSQRLYDPFKRTWSGGSEAGMYDTQPFHGSFNDGIYTNNNPSDIDPGDLVKDIPVGEYPLKPIEKVAIWKGRWGSKLPNWTPFSSLGPESPMFRNDDNDLSPQSLWSDLKSLFNKYRKPQSYECYGYVFSVITQPIP